MSDNNTNAVPAGLDYWDDEDDNYTWADWVDDVRAGNTRLGYWQGVSLHGGPDDDEEDASDEDEGDDGEAESDEDDAQAEYQDDIRHMKYVGPVWGLGGQLALVRPSATGLPLVLAQFDNKELAGGLGFNWHPFHVQDFAAIDGEEST